MVAAVRLSAPSGRHMQLGGLYMLTDERFQTLHTATSLFRSHIELYGRHVQLPHNLNETETKLNKTISKLFPN